MQNNCWHLQPPDSLSIHTHFIINRNNFGTKGAALILVIDIGNTTIAFTGIAGDHADGKNAARCRDLSVLFEAKLPTETGKDAARFLQEAELLLAQHGIAFLQDHKEQYSSENEEAAPGYLDQRQVQAVALSSVVPAATPAAVRLSEKVCTVPPVRISCKSDSGLSFDSLPAPDRVGTDRIADSAWAAARYPLPAMTADLGTATTINVIAAPGQGDKFVPRRDMTVESGILRPGALGTFLGGMIGAGVRTSLQALRTGTAQLPDLEPGPVASENLIGIDTDGCMLSSAIVGTAAQIEGLAARVEEQLGMPLTLILTGGNAGYVSPWIRRPFIYEPSLASKGAAIIALRELAKMEVQSLKGTKEGRVKEE